MESRFNLFGDCVSLGARLVHGCTIGSETIMEAPDDNPRLEDQVEGRFDMFGDSANLDAR